MKLRVLILVLMSALFSGAAFAQSTSPRAMCAPTNAEKATLAGIAADPAAWLGRCVTVKGIYSNERVYADIDAIYGVTRSSIGGYVDGGESGFGFWRGEFTGRVSDCARAAADIESGLLRSPGILIDNNRQAGCLAPQGQFLLFMSQGDLQPVKLVRRKPGGKGGDLAPAPKDWPHLQQADFFASQFELAMQSTTSEMMSTLLGNSYQAELVRSQADNALSALKKPGVHALAIFVREPSTADKVSAEACWCLTSDCRKTWPIAQRDADNQASRPYACLRIDGSKRLNGLWRYNLDATADRYGAPER